MNRLLVKPLLAALLLGAALFIFPFFFIRAVIFFLIIGTVFRLYRRWKRSKNPVRAHHRELHPAVADVIRHMSDQEYAIYRQTLEAHYSGHSRKKEQVIEIE